MDTFGAMHGLYFMSYGLIATIAALVIAFAQYKRNKNEGVPMNYTVLKLVSGVALAMWTGAAFTSVAYTTNSTTTTAAGFCLGVLLSVFFAWQLNVVVRKIAKDERALRDLATTDSLTGLWNRRVFHEVLNSEITRSTRFGHPVSLLMLNIDNFGAVNDTHGHKVGDIVLRELGRRLQVALRTIDSACRVRSDEMGLILPQTSLSSVKLFCERLKDEITAEPIQIDHEKTLDFTVSIGCASFSEHTKTQTALFEAAQNARLVAIESGGNRIAYDAACEAQEAATEAQQVGTQTSAMAPA